MLDNLSPTSTVSLVSLNSLVVPSANVRFDSTGLSNINLISSSTAPSWLPFVRSDSAGLCLIKPGSLITSACISLAWPFEPRKVLESI